MEVALREALADAGFEARICRCLETHPVLRLRMRGPTQLTMRQVTRGIRNVVQHLGHRVARGSLAASWRAGRFDGAFVMEADF